MGVWEETRGKIGFGVESVGRNTWKTPADPQGCVDKVIRLQAWEETRGKLRTAEAWLWMNNQSHFEGRAAMALLW